MARPLQHVHHEQRRIGELHEEDLVAGNLGDAGRIVLERERMEAVEHQPQMRMIGALDDRPCLAEEIGVPAPRERLEADAQVSLGGALGERVELLGRAFLVGQRVGPRVRAHEHELRAQRLHHVELALGALEAALEHRVRRPFEVAKRLVQLARETEIGGHCADLGRRAVEVDEVGLEELEAVEARRRDRFELLPQGAAHRNGGDRLAHCSSVSSAAAVSRKHRFMLPRHCPGG